MYPVVGAVSSADDGWSFPCCDRQNDPSGWPGLQYKAEVHAAFSEEGLDEGALIKYSEYPFRMYGVQH